MAPQEKLGCADEMCTVAAMLSAERIFAPMPKGQHGQQHSRNTPAGIPESVLALDTERVGDHIMLMRLYEQWARCDFSAQFCTEHSVQLRGMNFAKDVRRQLLGVVAQKLHAGASATVAAAGGGARDAGRCERRSRCVAGARSFSVKRAFGRGGAGGEPRSLQFEAHSIRCRSCTSSIRIRRPPDGSERASLERLQG